MRKFRCSLKRQALRALSLTVALAGLLLLQGCWVYSVNPLYDDTGSKDSDLTSDAALLGSWTLLDSGCLVTLTVTSKDGMYQLTQMPSSKCDSNEKVGRFEGHLVKLDTHLYLDVSPRREDVCDLCMPMHSFFQVEANKTSLRLTPIDDEWLRGALEDKTVTLSAIPGNDVVLTAPTKELKDFVRKYADNKAAFKPDRGVVYSRSLPGAE